MRKVLMVAVVAAMLAVIMVPAVAQNQGRGGQRGQGQGGVGGQFFRGGQQAGNVQGRFGRSYLETTPASKALWIKLGQLQVKMHEAQWKWYEVLNERPVNQDKVRAQLEVIRDINQKIRQVRQDLQPYRKNLRRPPRAGGGAGDVPPAQ